MFEAKRSPPSCPVVWSVFGPLSLLGPPGGASTADGLAVLTTVNGNAVGDGSIRVTDAVGRFWQIPRVPVVQQRNIPLRVVIVRDDAGQNAAIDIVRVAADVAVANLIWEQAGIQFSLNNGQGGDYSNLDNLQYLNPASAVARRDLKRIIPNSQGGIEVYYVKSCPDDLAIEGYGDEYGVVICVNAILNKRTLAHELGHAMGLGHGGSANLHLMYKDVGYIEGDITLAEVLSLSRFSSIEP